MDHFLYRDGALYAEDVPVAEIAAAVGTPFYVYSTATLIRHFRLFDEALSGMDHLVCYAMKAASNQAILKTLAAEGAGMDVVSGGEYRRARAAGVPGERIVFSGVGKYCIYMLQQNFNKKYINLAIEINNISKSFGDKQVLKNISLQASHGEVWQR